jgi:hypothetical protein
MVEQLKHQDQLGRGQQSLQRNLPGELLLLLAFFIKREMAC